MKLKEYEKTALKFYTNNNDDKKIVTAVGFNTDSVANKMAEELGNPYRLMFQWI
jgi:predicted phosphoribosyltransferase